MKGRVIVCLLTLFGTGCGSQTPPAVPTKPDPSRRTQPAPLAEVQRAAPTKPAPARVTHPAPRTEVKPVAPTKPGPARAKEPAPPAEVEAAAPTKAGAPEVKQPLLTLSGDGAVVTAVAFSPDGRRVLTVAYKTARLCDPATGEEIRRWQSSYASNRVLCVGFSPKGGEVFMGTSGGTARLWDAATGKEIRKFNVRFSWVVTAVAFSPDGRQVLIGGDGGIARLCDVPTGKEIRGFKGHFGLVGAVAFPPDGRQVLTGGWDGTVRLWDAATGNEVRKFEGDFGSDRVRSLDGSTNWRIQCVAFSPDGRQVLAGAAGDFEGKNAIFARVWDRVTGKEIAKLATDLRGVGSHVNSVAFSRDARQVLIGSGWGIARLWDVPTGKEIRRFVGHFGPVWAVAFSPDGRHVLTGRELWEVAGGKE